VRQSPPAETEIGKQGLGRLKSLALLPVPVFVVLIIYFAYVDPGTVFEPPYLLPALNILFTTVIPFSIAYLAWLSYAGSGQWRFFFIGCGAVALGVGSLLAGLTINVPGGVNLSVAVYNTGAFIGAALTSAAAVLSLTKSARHEPRRHRALYLGLYYLAVTALILLFTVWAYVGLVPPFFNQGTGPTLLRQVILGAAAALFAFSSIIFLIVYSRSRSDFTYWFSIALILIAIGLCSVFLQKSVGGPGGWTGRAAQYLGCAYMLVGIAALSRVANIEQAPLETEFARSFNFIEANYKTLVDMAGDAIISVDRKGTILTWNPAAASILGYSASEAVGANALDLIFPGEPALLIKGEQKKAGSKNMAADVGSKLETVARRKRGEVFPVEVSMSLKRVAGEWMGTFIIRDISERTARETEYRTIISTALDSFWLADAQGHFLDVNQSYISSIGYSYDELMNMSVSDVEATERPDEILKRIDNIIKVGIDRFETRHRRKDGGILDLEVSVNYLPLKDGRFFVFARDITDRKWREAALQESEERFAVSFNMSPDPTAVSVPETGQFVNVNSAFEKWSGFSMDELVGGTSRELNLWVNPADRDIFLNRLRKKQPVEDIDIAFRIRSGEIRHTWFTARTALVGGREYLLTRAHDITERKLAEKRILSQRAILAAINRVFEETLRCGTDVEVAAASLSVAQELSGSKFGWIGEVNASGRLDTIALSDPGWESCRMPQSKAAKMIRDMDVRGIWGRVLKDGKSLIANMPASHPDSVGLPQGHPELTAFMGVPLKHAGRTIGMIALANKPGGYAIDDQEAVEALSVALVEALSSRRAEGAILKSKLLLQSVIDSTPDWMYVKDRQHRFLLVNKSFAEAQNLTPQDIIGRPDTDFFPAELCMGDPERGIPGFHADDNLAFKGQMVHNPKNIVTWADGSMHIYDSYKIPLADQSGEIYAALVYSRDMTEQRAAEDEREASYRTIRKTLHDVINTMAKIVEMRDPYTSGHQGRVARLAGAIAREMKLDDSRIEHLMMAASIHDVGKMYVPADILSKPGKLLDIEWAMIKTHVQGSYEILKDLEFSQPIALMALQHHERLDGSGYPNGLKGDEMLLEAKILAVADVVEAMSSHRPYRPALGIEKALEEISVNRGVLYDPNVVDFCVTLFRQNGFQFEV